MLYPSSATVKVTGCSTIAGLSPVASLSAQKLLQQEKLRNECDDSDSKDLLFMRMHHLIVMQKLNVNLPVLSFNVLQCDL